MRGDDRQPLGIVLVILGGPAAVILSRSRSWAAGARLFSVASLEQKGTFTVSKNTCSDALWSS